jgi:acetyl-CoA acetyltransferase
VGIGLSDYPKAPDLDGVQHHVLAAQRALADSGVAKSELDGYVNAGGGGGMMIDDAVTMAEYLRIDHRYIDGTMTGGSSFEFHVQHAAAAIRDGACDTAIVTYGSDQLSRMGRSLGTGGMHRGVQRVAGPSGYEAPYGNSLVGSYAMVAQRHMHEFGTTSERSPRSRGARSSATHRDLPHRSRSTTSSAAAWSPTRCTSSTAVRSPMVAARSS